MILGALVGFTFSFSSYAGNVATVNGKAISEDDFRSLVSGLPEYQKNLAVKDAITRKQIIQDMVDQELMVQEATNDKMENTKEYKDALNQMRKQALINVLVAKKLAPKVSEKAVKDYFAKNRTQYSSDQVRAMHILLPTEAEARTVMAEVKKAGVDFQKVAEAKSKDPSVKNTRGDVGFFTRNLFDRAFSDAAFAANVGDIVGPVKTSFGFHVIKVVDRKVGKVPEFAEVEQQVRADFQKDLLRNYVFELRKKATIKE
jgi:peptidyl-prolyl cis-trans isomerase C